MSTTSIVLANPIIRAGAAILAAPSRKVRLVSPGDIPATIAAANPVAKKTALSSAIYQWCCVAP